MYKIELRNPLFFEMNGATFSSRNRKIHIRLPNGILIETSNRITIGSPLLIETSEGIATDDGDFVKVVFSDGTILYTPNTLGDWNRKTAKSLEEFLKFHPDVKSVEAV